MTIDKIFEYFIPGYFYQNTEKWRKARYFSIAHFILLFILIIYISYFASTGDWLFTKLFTICFFYTIGALFLHKKIGFTNFFTHIGLFVFSVLMWTEVWFRGGVFSPMIMWLSFVPVFAFILGGFKSGIIWSINTFFVLMVFYLGESLGYFQLRHYTDQFDVHFYFKAFAPFLIFYILIILYYEKGKLNDFRNLEEAQKLIVQKNKLLEDSNEEIRLQRDDISEKNQKLQQAYDDITASLYYARIIQNAMLPNNGLKNDNIKDYFVYFKPKDIVSGDFFWLTETNNKLFIAIGDCTGHGVPGAFMSIIGITALSEIVRVHQIHSTSEILKLLNQKIYETLKQESSGCFDGMDVAICCIDTTQKSIEFSGAKQNMRIAKSEGMEIIKGDRITIGGSYDNEFQSTLLEYTGNEKFYLNTDGLVDQFDKDLKKKFLSSRFEQFIEDNYQYLLNNQKEKLIQIIDSWKGDVNQIDDILVVGFQLKS